MKSTENKNKIIKIGCDGTDYINFESLSEFQEDIKIISKENLSKLKESIKKSFKQPISIWKQNKKIWILDGHQRKKALTDLKNEGWEIPPIPVVEIFEKTKAEAKMAVLELTSQHGEFKIDALRNYLHKYNINLTNIVLRKSPLMLRSESKNIYTQKIESPVYTPKGEKPAIKDLFNSKKAKQMIEKINKSSVSKEEKEFLIKAANRHVIFNFKLIAEYYANSEKEMQELMEDSALVILDFNKAIEDGFIVLSQEIAAQYKEEHHE